MLTTHRLGVRYGRHVALTDVSFCVEPGELVAVVGYQVVENSTGKQLMTGAVNGRTSFFVTPDLQTDEQQALPLAFSDAAVKLASRLSEGF